MANDLSQSVETIASEIEAMRQQIRSYAQQRAEGLIDADLQRDLVKDLQAKIDVLETKKQDMSQSNGSSPADKPEDAKAEKSEKPVATVDENSDDTTQEEEAKPAIEAKAEDTQQDKKPDDEATTADDETKSEAVAEPTEEETAPDVEATTEDDTDITEVEESVMVETESKKDKSTIRLADFADEVVVSSAIVRRDDSGNSIHEANVVDIRDITKTYQMGEFELQVLKGITLQVRKGEFISIMGPSGSGKSTLMNILGALDKPSSGEYFLDNVDVSKLNEKQLAEIRNSKIGFVFQSFNLLKRTSALRQVELPLIYGNHKDRSRRAREALESVGLGQRLDHTPAELSGGQQQRVAIARALVTSPSLILADEPTGNLDSRSGTEVMQIFQSLNRNNHITTIFVTHDPWIARHTDRVIMLRDGKIIADQRVKDPLIAGETERPSEAEELQAIFESTYYGGDEGEYT